MMKAHVIHESSHLCTITGSSIEDFKCQLKRLAEKLNVEPDDPGIALWIDIFEIEESWIRINAISHRGTDPSDERQDWRKRADELARTGE